MVAYLAHTVLQRADVLAGAAHVAPSVIEAALDDEVESLRGVVRLVDRAV